MSLRGPENLSPSTGPAAPGFLVRLARDRAGNALALAAAAVLPLIGVIGGGVDLSRLYLVRTRLQHACDAGALAGRKQMGAGAWTAGGAGSADAAAKRMFDGNMPPSAFGATGVARTFAEADGTVTGSAGAAVPMTLTAAIGAGTRAVSVACSARQQVPNTDVMFVLDTTESMSEDADDGSNHQAAGATPAASSKIVAVRAAVKCFFEALTKQDTGEPTCDPVTGTATSARLRFGLVPYSTNVNIGQLGLPPSSFAGEWTYDSRDWTGTRWRYRPVSFRLGNFSQGARTLSLPLGARGAARVLTWDGCAEEAEPLTDVNAVPGLSDATRYAPSLPAAIYYRRQLSVTMGANGLPLLDRLGRATLATAVNALFLSRAESESTDDYFSASTYPYYSCPSAAYSLAAYGPGGTPVATFLSRVDAMRHAGNTRHDIGMLWGGRLLSPRGAFASTNASAPNGGPVYRHLVFMTDGDAKANECDYATYGVPWLGEREVPAGTVLSKTGCGNLGQANADLTAGVNDRLSRLCEAVKAERNTVLWVIAFGGTGITADTRARLAACASGANYYFDATDDGKLRAAFRRIAAQVSQLRLSA